MKTIIYILGQSYCGSTAWGFALGNNPGVKLLGETKCWMWGLTVRNNMIIDFSKHPEEDVVVDTSKCIWRLQQLIRSKYDVKIIWLTRPLLSQIKSRLKHHPRHRLAAFTIPFIVRIANWLHLRGKSHVRIHSTYFSRYPYITQRCLEKFIGHSLPCLHDEFATDGVVSGNPGVLVKGKDKLR